MGDCYVDPTERFAGCHAELYFGPPGRGRWFSFETYHENPDFRRSGHPRDVPPELLSTFERLCVEGG
jgi:hypothetical protein